jgi:hypothetical protein
MLIIFIEVKYLSFKANRGRNNDYMDITITPEAPVDKAVLSK